MSHLTENERIGVKTKCLKTFQGYKKIKLRNEDQNVINDLMKNETLSILRQDKGRGVVLLDKKTYVEKSLAFLEGRQFQKLETDPTKSFQSRVQRKMLSMKKAFSKDTYKKLYPSASHPGLYFGLAKVHKLDKNAPKVESLPLRPVISNIGTATYEISKYLSKVIAPIAKSSYTIESTKDFINKLKGQHIGSDFVMTSFDVTSLFTNVPLDYTINVILDKIYKKKLINTKLKREEFKQLLELCTKEMHFSFEGEIYKQVDGVAMGSPLGPVLANIFMVELENTLVPQLGRKMALWERYVDDTFTFIHKNEIENVKNILNTFHKDIQFTHEIEKNESISFLDVSVIRKSNGQFSTGVYRKATDTNIYINWKSFSPKAWKIGTLKGLFRRAYVVCSEKTTLEKEINHLKKVFTKINGYPSKVVYNTLQDVIKKIGREAILESTSLVSESNGGGNMGEVSTQEEFFPHICLPYKGFEGEKVINNFKNYLCKFLPKTVRPRFIYKGKKIGSFFKLKDTIDTDHLSDLVYGYFDKEDPIIAHYVGETNVRYGTRTHEHVFTDKQSAIYKSSRVNSYEVSREDFRVIEKGYSAKIDRKIAEALYISKLKPKLNEQVKSYTLKLFN